MKISLIMTRDRLVQTLRWAGMQNIDSSHGEQPQSPVRFKRAVKRASRRGFGERW